MARQLPVVMLVVVTAAGFWYFFNQTEEKIQQTAAEVDVLFRSLACYTERILIPKSTEVKTGQRLTVFFQDGSSHNVTVASCKPISIQINGQPGEYWLIKIQEDLGQNWGNIIRAEVS